eukprot:Plantae.Rhodophyta-Palmaria_palmata.ctg13684.p2 GENE.Plantae.Rhodophyta-Palmaria_palmata.ctg13684~~Plantae.Rhodophyta-Palmaria_palmata.ctg13684.p2  ORF type:complete len:212 (+),score=19.91 Plantae.Rhodophyta-Palmaria_palmata.ctg13684:153-788(+)
MFGFVGCALRKGMVVNRGEVCRVTSEDFGCGWVKDLVHGRGREAEVTYADAAGLECLDCFWESHHAIVAKSKKTRGSCAVDVFLRGEEEVVWWRGLTFGEHAIVFVRGIEHGEVPVGIEQVGCAQGVARRGSNSSDCALSFSVHVRTVGNSLRRFSTLSLKKLVEGPHEELESAISLISTKIVIGGELNGSDDMQENFVCGELSLRWERAE